MYQFTSRIRYSEADESGCLSLSALMNYLQDCTLFHSESVGCGVRWLEQHDRAWLLSGWQIRIYRRPRFLEQIAVLTKPYAFQGILGYRSFELRSESDELLVFANSVWCYVRPSVMRPVPAGEEDMAPYRPLDAPPGEFAQRKLRVPAGGRAEAAFRVRREHLDTNHHVNNGQYITLAADYLAADFVIDEVRAEYRNQARLGDIIVPVVTEEEGQTAIVLGNGDKKIYAVVIFLSAERKK